MWWNAGLHSLKRFVIYCMDEESTNVALWRKVCRLYESGCTQQLLRRDDLAERRVCGKTNHDFNALNDRVVEVALRITNVGAPANVVW